VTGLDRDAFSVAEDDANVPIERVSVASDSQVPIAFGLVIDVSGSMNDAGKLDAAKQAASQLVASLGPADTAAVISFGDRADVVQAMTANKDALNAAIASLHAGGNTALYDAIVKTTLLADVLPQPYRVQLVVTDGADTSSTAHLSDVVNGLGGGQSLVYAVGLGSDVDRSVLDQIAAAGSGEALYTSDPSDLGSDFQSVLDRLRLTYVLRYRAPSAAASGQAHAISTNVTHQGQVAQAVGSFTPGADTLAIDVGGVTPGEVVTGNRQVRATVRSGTAQRMDLLLDGATAASSGGQPSSIVGDLAGLAPGDHDLEVRAVDALGNVTMQHVPFTVPGAAAPASPAAAPEVSAEPVQTQQAAPAEPPTWLLWLGLLLVLAAAAIYLWWLAVAARPASEGAAAAVAQDDATLDLAVPEDGLASGQPEALLRVESQGQRRDVVLGSVLVSIGRDADNTVILRDLHVSRHHARISLEDGQYWIEDLNSQNGTLLNGQTRIDRRQLQPGDQFAIGSATVTYAPSAEPAAAEEPQLAAAAAR
jgi:VWFA-related protein